MSDRVSTLEGRQSAFQSQLAQISKVLGLPVGKQAKNSQIKNLVQTLREEIDGKIKASMSEVQQSCTETIAVRFEDVLSSKLKAAPVGKKPCDSHLPSDKVLATLSEEHAASMTKLSGFLSDRAQELEQHVQSRLVKYEEWLQQLEGEFNAFHRNNSALHSRITSMEQQLTQTRSKLEADVQAILSTHVGTDSDESGLQAANAGAASREVIVSDRGPPDHLQTVNPPEERVRRPLPGEKKSSSNTNKQADARSNARKLDLQ